MTATEALRAVVAFALGDVELDVPPAVADNPAGGRAARRRLEYGVVQITRPSVEP